MPSYYYFSSSWCCWKLRAATLSLICLGGVFLLLLLQTPPGVGGEEGMCRHRRWLPPTLFQWDTCAWCYKYMPNRPTIFTNKLNTTIAVYPDPAALLADPDGEGSEGGYLNSAAAASRTYYILVLVSPSDGTRMVANVSDVENSEVWDSFATEASRKDWIDCCNAASACCESILDDGNRNNNGSISDTAAAQEDDDNAKGCPPTWDGWQCWSQVRAGTTAVSTCPPYIYFVTEPPSCEITLEKECLSDGSGWGRRPNSNNSRDEWTNFGPCGQATVNLQKRRAYVLIAAYGVSIVTIVPALVIFASYKQLRVHRIMLHQNLLGSFLMNGVLVIMFKSLVMLDVLGGRGDSVIEGNGVGCRLLLILTKYSRMTNYMWMFCEGFYLHRLIAAAFAEQKSLLVFYLIGWVFPLFPTALYGVYRAGWADRSCWVVPEEGWEWALNGPSLLSLLLNALFLVNIIRVLVTKLRAAHANEPSQYRKAVRATLVLLPLFGLHFLVTIYRPHSSTATCALTTLYFYANDILDGVQGSLVALIFCYFNGEVSQLLRRTWNRLRDDWLPETSSTRKRRGQGGRSGSLGRSVMSTHVYSSVPPSPETHTGGVIIPPSPSSAAHLLSSCGNGGGGNNTSLLAPPANGGVPLYVRTSEGQGGGVTSSTSGGSGGIDSSSV